MRSVCRAYPGHPDIPHPLHQTHSLPFHTLASNSLPGCDLDLGSPSLLESFSKIVPTPGCFLQNLPPSEKALRIQPCTYKTPPLIFTDNPKSQSPQRSKRLHDGFPRSRFLVGPSRRVCVTSLICFGPQRQSAASNLADTLRSLGCISSCSRFAVSKKR